jgi:protein-L-isoaspartate(D-aspartate) O-methyltransferase
MTELLRVSKQHRVLEIGTGSGYQAAILAQLSGTVYSVEIVPELARSAAKTLRELGYANVTVHQADGYRGWPGQAPFDRIIVTAAPPDIPNALIEQLAKGGASGSPRGRRMESGTRRHRKTTGRKHQAGIRRSGYFRAHAPRREPPPLNAHQCWAGIAV